MIIEMLTGVLKNLSLLTALTAMFLAQASKIIYYLMIEKKLNWHHFFAVGGMPSSHSAMVCCLSMMVGFQHGFDSSYFSIATVLSAIVMHDAIKIRPEEVEHTLLEVSTGGIFGAIVSIISYMMFLR